MLVSLRGYRDVNSSSYLKISDHSLNLHQLFKLQIMNSPLFTKSIKKRFNILTDNNTCTIKESVHQIPSSCQKLMYLVVCQELLSSRYQSVGYQSHTDRYHDEV